MHGNPSRILALTGLLAALASGTASGAALATYNFTAGSADAAFDDTQVSASTFLIGPGLLIRDNGTGSGVAPGFSPGYARANAGNIYGAGTAPGSEATAIEHEEYFSFKISAVDGYLLNLEQITFKTSYHKTEAEVFAYFFLRSSLDEYAATIGNVIEQPMANIEPSFSDRSISLNTPAFQNLGGEVEFRIYMYENNNSTSRWLALDDVVLSGGVSPIPEPSALVLLSTGLALTLRRTRRR
jgi:hypothetical protein